MTRPRRRVFPGRPEQVAHARRFVTQTLDGCPTVDEAVLCVSELAANALAHTASGNGGEFEIIVCRGQASALIVVYDDGSATPPAVRDLDATSEDGRGLGVVALTASRWGNFGGKSGRVVWFEMYWDPPPVDATLQVSQVPSALTARMPLADPPGAAAGGPSPGPDQCSVDLARRPTKPPGYKENAWMPTAFDFAMTEHVAWRTSEHGHRRMFGLPDGSRWLVASRDHQLLPVPPTDSAKQIVFDVFTMPVDAFSEIPELANALGTLGVVARFRTTDLWDAVGTAIIRQVIRAAQARRLYQGFCDACGDPGIFANSEEHAIFPDAQTVLDLPAEQFAILGMAFKRRPLQAAAEAYLKYGDRWRELPPAVLVSELQQVPRIGAWTAGAAVADFSNDFSCYPYADLAIRTWARKAAPSYAWPADEKTFGQLWRTHTGDQLSALTLLTLAWGNDMDLRPDHTVAGADLSGPLDAVFINAPIRDYSLRPRVNDFTLPVLGLGYIATYAAQQGHNVGVIDAESHGLSSR